MKTQIWTAVSVYVLVAIVKKRLGLERSLYAILKILNVSLFEKEPIFTALSGNGFLPEEVDPEKQLGLVIQQRDTTARKSDIISRFWLVFKSVYPDAR